MEQETFDKLRGIGDSIVRAADAIEKEYAGNFRHYVAGLCLLESYGKEAVDSRLLKDMLKSIDSTCVRVDEIKKGLKNEKPDFPFKSRKKYCDERFEATHVIKNKHKKEFLAIAALPIPEREKSAQAFKDKHTGNYSEADEQMLLYAEIAFDITRPKQAKKALNKMAKLCKNFQQELESALEKEQGVN